MSKRNPSSETPTLPNPAPSAAPASKFPKVGSIWRGPDGLAVVKYINQRGLVQGRFAGLRPAASNDLWLGEMFILSLEAFRGGFEEVKP